MKIYDEEINFCLNRAREVATEYRLRFLNTDGYERSVDRLVEIAEDIFQKKIELFELDVTRDESPILGSCMAYDDNVYHVCYVKGLNYCWRRFIICKELFHAIIDKDEYRNVSLCLHVDEATAVFPNAEYAEKPSVQVMAEQLAEIAAMEFLFPYDRREKELVAGDGINTHVIAERYRVPRVLAEKYLSSGYMGPLKKFVE